MEGEASGLIPSLLRMEKARRKWSGWGWGVEGVEGGGAG